jgi:hypothetical protein
MRAAAGGPRLAQAPLQLDGLREIGQRAVVVACPLAREAAIVLSPGVAWVDLDDGVEVAARGAEIALLKENDSTIK